METHREAVQDSPVRRPKANCAEWSQDSAVIVNSLFRFAFTWILNFESSSAGERKRLRLVLGLSGQKRTNNVRLYKQQQRHYIWNICSSLRVSLFLLCAVLTFPVVEGKRGLWKSEDSTWLPQAVRPFMPSRCSHPFAMCICMSEKPARGAV